MTVGLLSNKRSNAQACDSFKESPCVNIRVGMLKTTQFNPLKAFGVRIYALTSEVSRTLVQRIPESKWTLILGWIQELLWTELRLQIKMQSYHWQNFDATS